MEKEADIFFKLYAEYNPAQSSVSDAIVKAAEALWRSATAVDPKPLGFGPVKQITIEIGRTALSEAEKWKLQAAVRREETKGRQYNKAAGILPTKHTKGPEADEPGFPAGRGRPVR